MTEPIVIADYDAAWPARFEEERRAIEAALGDAMAGIAGIEHVGSTSVSGCAAKPIIDIMIGVRPLAHGDRCVRPIESLGYEYKGEQGVAGRYYFGKGAPRTHHLHLVEHESDFWRDHLAFRDLLRARPDLVREYSALKRELAERHRVEREAYTDAKSPFIQAALAQSRP